MALKTKQSEETTIPVESIEVVAEDPTTTTEVTVVEHSTAMQSFNVEDALAQWEAYQIFTEKLLDKSDYIDIKGKAFKKKSAWRKYGNPHRKKRSNP